MSKNNEEDEKELSEYVIKRIVDGDVFFLGNDDIVSMLEEGNRNAKFERTRYFDVKARGYDSTYKLYFIKKDEKLRYFASDIIKGAGANFETLIGFLFEENREKNTVGVHVYYIGGSFDLDKMSEMVYSIFSNQGKNYIAMGKVTIVE